MHPRGTAATPVSLQQGGWGVAIPGWESEVPLGEVGIRGWGLGGRAGAGLVLDLLLGTLCLALAAFLAELHVPLDLILLLLALVISARREAAPMGLFRHGDNHGDDAPSGHCFQMREKLLSIGDDWIEDEQGERAYKVDGKALRVRGTFVLEDRDGFESCRAR